jgi:glycine cleavage system H protein
MADLSEYLFTKEHEWLKVDGTRAKIGISEYAQRKLGDITFVEVPSIGKQFKRGDALTVIESVKAASDIYAPVSGKVTAVNNALESAPELVNKSPYKEGWIAEIELSNVSETDALMNDLVYAEYIRGLE